MNIRIWAAAALFGTASMAAAQAPTFEAKLLASRSPLRLEGGRLTGAGAELLQREIAQSRFVMIGEDHGTREIPAFVSAVCGMVGADRLSGYAVEAGPVAVGALSPMLKATDRATRVGQFAQAYPNAVAFLDIAEDNETAATCMKASGRRDFRIIGADQEFIGAGLFLLDRILATRLSGDARRALAEMRAREATAVAAARTSGDPSKLLMLAEPEANLDRVEAALARGGNAEAKRVFSALRQSRTIYATKGNRSNTLRASLLKQNFMAAMPASGTVVGRFGALHAYKGFNPLQNLDLGNFVAEQAEREGARSLHVVILGVRGKHATFAGLAKPFAASNYVMADEDLLRWFADAGSRQLPCGWTLFDLRTLRHARIAGIEPEWQRAINGIDILIVIPETTAARSAAER
ncbi:hypothetical protein GGQ97_002155 [Sphingomonas kaistensis]|uniref:Haem-binding uptake Tiki superfamily ChaN domain-containing protein n=1 Tax=Sphingomonas kaistensis TaxID=298708 RepID=A0A7X5Y892_9SPHN|nr:hypothetical protein [Sphingomonas kaistensis]NJC06362.1 hypothetical protein [Sphingomonas kaistensis]